MAIPKYEVFIEPVLRCLAVQSGPIRVRVASDAAAAKLELEDSDLSVRVSSGKLMYRDRAGWALHRLKHAGLAVLKDGGWSLTEAGREFCSANPTLTTADVTNLASLRFLPSSARSTHVRGDRSKSDFDRRAYRLSQKPLSEGGQAVVYSGVRKRDQKPIVLKRSKNLLGDERMRREIQIQSEMKHCNVMPIIGSDSADYRWYVMPRGIQVMSALRRPLEHGQLKEIVYDLCSALEYAHGLGHPHRDVKPQNVLEIDDGVDGRRWVLADWGLTRRAAGHTSSRLTKTGEFVGTEGFAPPESYVDSHKVGAPGDVYSLGQLIAWALGVEPVPNVAPVVVGPWGQIVTAMTRLIEFDRVQTVYEARKLMAWL